jgi:hypothetical protein
MGLFFVRREVVMQQWYQCPRCGAQLSYGAQFCVNCGQPLNWQQPQPPQQQYQQTPQYQQQAPPSYQQSSSICVNCQHQNYHGVDHNGEATVRCQSCSTVYNVKTYQVRAKGGRRDRASGIKSYSIRVKEPDRDETLLEFDSLREIEMRSGDWITGSYFEGRLKYLSNQTIRQYWDVQYGLESPKKKSKLGIILLVLGIILLASVGSCVVCVVLPGSSDVTSPETPSSTSPPATQTPPATFTPIVKSGTDSLTTTPFTITTDEWIIDWSYSTSDPDLAIFGFFIYPRGETEVYTEAVLFPEATSGSTYSYAGPGEYYIKTNVANIDGWEITIRPAN